MFVEVINKAEAIKKATELKAKAFAIADSFGTLPGYCQEPECIAYCEFAALTQLKESEACIFINGSAAMQLTDFKVEGGQSVIGKMCVGNLSDAYIQNGDLFIKYADGVVECFKHREDIECWVFHSNNASIGKPHYGVLN